MIVCLLNNQKGQAAENCIIKQIILGPLQTGFPYNIILTHQSHRLRLYYCCVCHCDKLKNMRMGLTPQNAKTHKLNLICTECGHVSSNVHFIT